jgi:hypothetical protein
MMIPTLINGVLGETDEAELKCRTGGHDDEDETVTFVEYYLRTTGEMVHRSAHIILKKLPVFAEPAVASF